MIDTFLDKLLIDDVPLGSSFVDWINKRHAIYLKKEEGVEWPWTDDEIFQKYKFTNVFRELDRTTVWMREHLTNPNAHKPHALMIYNCAIFRMFGTMEMCEAIGGWQNDYEPDHLKRVARDRLNNKLKVFTGAYIITNQGKKEPKENVVVDEFLFAIWDYRNLLAQIAEQQSLQRMHENLGKLKGWGGGGFMAYELVSDLRHTPVLANAEDINTWANAGPGAKRGLNRVFGRPLNYSSRMHNWNREMTYLLKIVNDNKESFVPTVEMREVEHCLCEFDKYQRVKNGEGKPRSIYQPPGQERSKWARYRARRKEKINEENLRGTPDLLQSQD